MDRRTYVLQKRAHRSTEPWVERPQMLTTAAFFEIQQQGSVLIKSKSTGNDDVYQEVGCYEFSLFDVVLDQLEALLRISWRTISTFQSLHCWNIDFPNFSGVFLRDFFFQEKEANPPLSGMTADFRRLFVVFSEISVKIDVGTLSVPYPRLFR